MIMIMVSLLVLIVKKLPNSALKRTQKCPNKSKNCCQALKNVHKITPLPSFTIVVNAYFS